MMEKPLVTDNDVRATYSSPVAKLNTTEPERCPKYLTHAEIVDLLIDLSRRMERLEASALPETGK